MAIDLTTGGPIPLFVTTAVGGVSVACTEIRAPAYHRVQVFAPAALFVFNAVADAGTVAAATLRLAVTATQAAAGYEVEVGGPVSGVTYGTVCVAAQAATTTVTAVLLPPVGRNR